jgi:hypothetical protein
MAPSDSPGFGVELDEEKMNRYEHEYKALSQSDYGYPPDPKRPQWYAKVPNW